MGSAILVLSCAIDPYKLGVQYDQSGQHGRAVAEFTKAIAADPTHPAPRHGRALANINLGEYKSALKDLDEAIRLDKSYYLAYYSRGTLYSERVGLHRRAIRDFDRSIELNSQFALAYQNRGVAYRALDQRDKACRDWRKACELGFSGGCVSVEKLC
jgi:tetratricopeptide (TPR) repeat protein